MGEGVVLDMTDAGGLERADHRCRYRAVPEDDRDGRRRDAQHRVGRVLRPHAECLFEFPYLSGEAPSISPTWTAKAVGVDTPSVGGWYR